MGYIHISVAFLFPPRIANPGPDFELSWKQGPSRPTVFSQETDEVLHVGGQSADKRDLGDAS